MSGVIDSLLFVLLFVEFCEVLGDHLVSDRVVLEVTLDEGFVRRHVDETVTREVEEDDFLLARLLALVGLADGGGDGVTTLGCRDDTLRTGEEHTSLAGLELWDIDTIHITVLDQLGDDHTCTMVAQTTSVDVRGLEVMAQREHRQQWGISGLVAKVVAELTACELRTAVGLGCDELCVTLTAQVMTHEGEGDTTEIGTTTEAADHDVGVFACHRHLLLCLQADDGLVESYVIQHGAERLFTVRRGGGELYCL